MADIQNVNRAFWCNVIADAGGCLCSQQKQNHCQTRNKNYFFHKNNCLYVYIFLREFRALNWQEVLTLEDENINFFFNSFNSKVSKLVGRHLPTKRPTKKQLLKTMDNSGIMKSMSKRDTYFRKFLHSKSDESSCFYHTVFKRYRNQIVALCRRSKVNELLCQLFSFKFH